MDGDFLSGSFRRVVLTVSFTLVHAIQVCRSPLFMMGLILACSCLYITDLYPAYTLNSDKFWFFLYMCSAVVHPQVRYRVNNATR
jgi:hypothetical protein